MKKFLIAFIFVFILIPYFANASISLDYQWSVNNISNQNSLYDGHTEVIARTTKLTSSPDYNYAFDYSSNYIDFEYVSPNSSYFCSIDLWLKKIGQGQNLILDVYFSSDPALSSTELRFTLYPTIFPDQFPNTQDLYRVNFKLTNDVCFLTLGGDSIFFRLRQVSASDTDRYYFGNYATPDYQPASTISAKIYRNGTQIYTGARVAYVIYGITELNPQLPIEPNALAYSCQPTNYSLFDVDFGRNFCEIITYLFMPNPTFFDGFFNSINDLMKQKAPFSYYYQLKDQIQNINLTSSGEYLIDNDITFPTSTMGDVTLTLQGFNTSSGSPERAVFNTFRPYINTFLWLSFAFYALTRIFRLFKPI